MTSFQIHVHQQLEHLERAGIRRNARLTSGPQGSRVSIDGRSVINLCSNDYLGLARHPALIAAARAAFDEQGLGAAGPRHIGGNMSAHRTAEESLARFVGHESSVLFSTGYACNTGVIQALVGRADVVFSDQLNHASLIDGARLSRAQVVVYAHGDADDLRRKLREHRADGAAALVVTESVFSMDGDVAPLRDIRALCDEHDAGCMVDEAHALGIFGPHGRGVAAELGVRPDVTVGTLGKAFGSQGAFAAGATPVAELIRNRARSYLFSTAPWPALGAVAARALRLVEESDALRAIVRGHWRTLRRGLLELGYRVVEGDSPIIPVVIGEPEPAMALSRRLFERGVFVHGVRPPTVPAGTSRLRVVPTAAHTDEDVRTALEAFAQEVRR